MNTSMNELYARILFQTNFRISLFCIEALICPFKPEGALLSLKTRAVIIPYIYNSLAVSKY